VGYDTFSSFRWHLECHCHKCLAMAECYPLLRKFGCKAHIFILNFTFSVLQPTRRASVTCHSVTCLKRKPRNGIARHTAQPFCEAASCSARQDILETLWKPDAHYSVQNNVLVVPIMCQINSIHILPFAVRDKSL
jgi:hypothetical protein